LLSTHAPYLFDLAAVVAHMFLFKACRMAPVGRPLIGHLLEVEDSYAVMLYAPSPDVICYPSVLFLSLFFFDTSVKKKRTGVTNYFCSLSGIPENCVNSVAGCITE